ncbi:MAG: ABC transporter permease subunit [Lachnospiraceae bacterium]|nr:ABC transporter permease subunit [Lachnospiraceae bacterium]
MRVYKAFLKKEFMEMARSGKLVASGIIFILFGIMNPAIAKLMPALMKVAAESMEEMGLVFEDVVVTDMTSWTQFYKNIPMALIIFLVMFSGTVTAEYQKGTIIPMLTKGISPVTVFLSKYSAVLLTWTAGYALTFCITYFYNEYFWGNVTENIVYTAVCSYVLGIFLLSVMMLMSVICKGNTSVIVTVAVIFFVIYMLSIIPDVKDYLPTKLMNSNELMVGKSASSDYTVSMVITITISVICAVASSILIRRKAV